MNFQVTVLKILVSYPDGFAVMEDLKRVDANGRSGPSQCRLMALHVGAAD
ncbi:hypothetical protein ABIB90_007129 [Bradyrhizobium sp. JR4.1]